MRTRFHTHPYLTGGGSTLTLTSPARHEAVTADPDFSGPPAMTQPRLELHSPTRHEVAAGIVEALDRTIDAPFMPSRERPSPEMLDRGVWTCGWYDVNGNPLLVAVQSCGRIATWASWLPSQTYEEVVAELQGVLDRADPI